MLLDLISWRMMREILVFVRKIKPCNRGSYFSQQQPIVRKAAESSRAVVVGIFGNFSQVPRTQSLWWSDRRGIPSTSCRRIPFG
uniref:Uncharacterized protein n=1 Tax=Lutzomyia longipalpis TaxID=7200 RepID=A0A1B0CQP5_LUTLO